MMRATIVRFARALALAGVAAAAACGPSSTTSQSSAPDAASSGRSLADVAANQRACIGALEAHLATLPGTRIDAFLAQTLNGLEVCDADYGLAHLPTRDVTAWLRGADGKPHANARVPDQPAQITTLPKTPEDRVAYQKFCIGWMDRFLPADISKSGDDPDTAAADVFNGIEECDAVAGFATISREDLAKMVKTKNLN